MQLGQRVAMKRFDCGIRQDAWGVAFSPTLSVKSDEAFEKLAGIVVAQRINRERPETFGAAPGVSQVLELMRGHMPRQILKAKGQLQDRAGFAWGSLPGEAGRDGSSEERRAGRHLLEVTRSGSVQAIGQELQAPVPERERDQGIGVIREARPQQLERASTCDALGKARQEPYQCTVLADGERP